MEDVKILNSSTGGLNVKGGGNVKVVKGAVENTNPRYKLFPSFRGRNILCEGPGELTIEGLKGGDGIQNGTSLWMLNSSGCGLKGISEERNSSSFIPTLRNATLHEEDSNYKLIFTGTLLFPCGLNSTPRN
jgi:hypothetical protein